MTTVPDLMHATQVARPFHVQGWIYEEKYDGWRMLALKEEGRVRLVSGNERDHTRRFPEIAAALAKLKPKTLILDAEVAVFPLGVLGDLFAHGLPLSPSDLAKALGPASSTDVPCISCRARGGRALPTGLGGRK